MVAELVRVRLLPELSRVRLHSTLPPGERGLLLKLSTSNWRSFHDQSFCRFSLSHAASVFGSFHLGGCRDVPWQVLRFARGGTEPLCRVEVRYVSGQSPSGNRHRGQGGLHRRPGG